MRALLSHRAAGSAQPLYSNRTARTLHNSLHHQQQQQQHKLTNVLLVALFFVCCSTLYFSWSLHRLKQDGSNADLKRHKEMLVTRIAFGSASAHDYSPQPVWVAGIIPSDPHAWVWLGDMAYLDEARVSCDALPNHPQCNCSANWLQQPPHLCMTGDAEHARSKMQAQLANPDYAQFLAFMCPGHRKRGLFPPAGSDPTVCPRVILGTYDDHDYSWKHGNKRLPHKDALKQVFLDAIGEAFDSPRRSRGRGIQWKYTLNQETKEKTIDVILLDTRYYRDPLPCYTRRRFCEEITIASRNTSHDQFAWCVDFLKGGESGSGSCCNKDEMRLHEWCLNEDSTEKRMAIRKDACDPSSPDFGAAISEVFGQTSFPSSSICEVLGSDQRKWLEDVLLDSDAPIKLLVSSSLVLPSSEGEPACSGDDWECYKLAQTDLLKLASKASGCVVILTGGSEFSDIRMLRPTSQTKFGGIEFSYPLYQVTSSGLTKNTRTNFSCDGECDFVPGPSFGMIEIADSMVKLQVRDGMTGQVKLESQFTLESC